MLRWLLGRLLQLGLLLCCELELQLELLLILLLRELFLLLALLLLLPFVLMLLLMLLLLLDSCGTGEERTRRHETIVVDHVRLWVGVASVPHGY